MIEVEGLSKYYGQTPAIMDVSFHVAEGEIVGFLGPNGAGKTTTMRILTGFMPATDGDARIAGVDVYDNSLEARSHIGYVPERVALYGDMRVDEYLRYCARLQRLGGSELAERVDRVVEQCGLGERRDQIIDKLSLGFRQRVGLAQALVHDPDVLILDEPTVGLDPNQITEVRQLIKSLAGERTVMLSTHILPEAQMTCERVIIIHKGRIIAEDTPEELTAQIRQAETILIELESPDENVRRLLEDIPQVSSVRNAEDGDNAFYIDTDVGTDVRSEIARFVVEKGWGLRELRSVEMSLEDVFHQLTTEEQGVA